jgi:hypothetical protein
MDPIKDRVEHILSVHQRVPYTLPEQCYCYHIGCMGIPLHNLSPGSLRRHLLDLGKPLDPARSGAIFGGRRQAMPLRWRGLLEPSRVRTCSLQLCKYDVANVVWQTVFCTFSHPKNFRPHAHVMMNNSAAILSSGRIRCGSGSRRRVAVVRENHVLKMRRRGRTGCSWY